MKKFHISYEPYKGVMRWKVRAKFDKDTPESLRRRPAFIIARSAESAMTLLQKKRERAMRRNRPQYAEH